MEMSSPESQPRVKLALGFWASCVPAIELCLLFRIWCSVGNMKFCCHPFQWPSTATGGVDSRAYAQACVG